MDKNLGKIFETRKRQQIMFFISRLYRRYTTSKFKKVQIYLKWI